MSKIRAFIAVETPGEIQAQALQLIRELSVSPATVKWVEPDAMHWSLKFLGEIELTDVAEGTLLTVVESGFDALPSERRAEAFRMNEGGWEAQIHNIDKYVSTH